MWRGRWFWEQSVLLSFLGRRRKVEETKGLQIGWPSGWMPCSDHLWPSALSVCLTPTQTRPDLLRGVRHEGFLGRAGRRSCVAATAWKEGWGWMLPLRPLQGR